MSEKLKIFLKSIILICFENFYFLIFIIWILREENGVREGLSGW